MAKAQTKAVNTLSRALVQKEYTHSTVIPSGINVSSPLITFHNKLYKQTCFKGK